MIKLHKVLNSADTDPRAIWVNDRNVQYLSEWASNDKSGAVVHMIGEAIMVAESRKDVLSWFGVWEEDSPKEEEEEPRVKIRRLLDEAGMEFVCATSRYGSCMTYKSPGDACVEIKTYVVESLNKFGQCSFTVNCSTWSSEEWVLFYAVPLDTMYLRKMSELVHSRKRKDGTLPTQINVTIREGSSTADLFHNRIEELVEIRKEI